MIDENNIWCWLWWSLLMIFMITLILIITMIVDWLVIIWWWTWFVIMIMPIDSRCLLLIDYDEKQDWWFIDDNWSWMMNDDKGHKWWFIVIDNDKPWMITDWLTDWLIDWLQDHNYKICHNSRHFQQSAGYIGRQASCLIFIITWQSDGTDSRNS